MLNAVKYAEEHYVDLQGLSHCLEYQLLVEEGEPCRYGVAVLDRDGESVRVRDLTTRRERAEQVLELLRRNLVTPVTLGDVVEDLL